MGIDKSLKTKGKLVRPRNVFSRIERIKILKGEGKWDSTMSVFGIPKVKKAIRVKRKAKEKKAAKTEATAEATPTTAGAPGKAEAASPAAEKGKTKK